MGSAVYSSLFSPRFAVLPMTPRDYVLICILTAYINQSPDTGTQVFNWLIAISGLSTVFMCEQ